MYNKQAMVERSNARPVRKTGGTRMWALAVLVLGIVAICALHAVGRIGQPFPGFFIWDNGFVPAVGQSSWSGARSGLRYHSWLLEVDGQPISDQAGNQAVVEKALAGKRIGTPVSYTLVKNGRRYTIDIPIMRMSPRAWLSVDGIYVFDALALLALGLIVLYIKPHDSAARALVVLCMALASALATATDLFGPSRFRELYFLSISQVPFAVMNLLSHFPVSRKRRAWENRALGLFALAGLALGAALNLSFTQDRELMIALDRLLYGALAASGLIAMIFFCGCFAVARGPMVRDRLKIVLLGTFSAWLLPVTVFSLYGGGIVFPFNVMGISIVLFPIGIGYAIAQHDLFHVDRVIKRTLVYFAVSAFVIGLYTASIATIEVLFNNLTEVASRVVQAALILLLLLITQPSRARIQDAVDRIYDRRRYNYRDVVRSASRAFATILDFEELVRTVLDLIDETLQPEAASVYTVDNEKSPQIRGRLDHLSGAVRRIELETLNVDEEHARRLVESLESEDVLIIDNSFDLVDSADGDSSGSSAADAGTDSRSPALRPADATLATSMRLEGRLVGMITVGRKRAGSSYNADDVELLRTISDQLAVALENAAAYKRIDRLNRELEANYKELAQSNQDLTEAQTQLLLQERLAAIGELSGAVAHAIRNPLAGIKAAAQLAELELEESPARAIVGDVISETDRLNDRISALLDFARPFEPDRQAMSINTIAEQAVRSTEQKAASNGVELLLEAAEDLPEVDIDPALFEEAAAELISNAIEISPANSRVTVRTGVTSDHVGNGSESRRVWLDVTDTGPGIRSDKQPRIFDIFFTTKPGGTGFGLATVKKIVERHGGTVCAGNVEPTGASFRIELPAVSSD